MSLHVNIDYTEGDPGSYRGVSVTKTGGAEVARWGSGDPQADWQSYLDWAKEQGVRMLEGSSITHFLMDVPGWRMILNDEGREIIVPEDRPDQQRVLQNFFRKLMRLFSPEQNVATIDGRVFTARQMEEECRMGSKDADCYIDWALSLPEFQVGLMKVARDIEEGNEP